VGRDIVSVEMRAARKDSSLAARAALRLAELPLTDLRRGRILAGSPAILPDYFVSITTGHASDNG